MAWGLPEPTLRCPLPSISPCSSRLQPRFLLYPLSSLTYLPLYMQFPLEHSFPDSYNLRGWVVSGILWELSVSLLCSPPRHQFRGATEYTAGVYWEAVQCHGEGQALQSEFSRIQIPALPCPGCAASGSFLNFWGLSFPTVKMKMI